MGRNCIAGYIGAKNKIVYNIAGEIKYEGINTYIEVFGGLYNLGLNKMPHPQEIYNDFNVKLAHLMYVLSNKLAGKKLLNKMMKTRYSEETFNYAKEISNNHIEIIDDTKEPSDEDIEIAVQIWVTLLQSYNGMMHQFRGIHKGNEQIIYGKRLIKKREIPNRLENIKVMNRDALELLTEMKNKEDIMIYCDPPYTFKERTCNKLYEVEMNTEQQIKFLNIIKDAKASILVSGYNNEIYNKVLTEANGWRSYPLVKVKKSSKIGRAGERKSTGIEYIWKNY